MSLTTLGKVNTWIRDCLGVLSAAGVVIDVAKRQVDSVKSVPPLLELVFKGFKLWERGQKNSRYGRLFLRSEYFEAR